MSDHEGVTDDRPDAQPHRRYTVTLRYVGGEAKSIQVLTNRGEAKAVALAVSRLHFGRRYPLDVDVRDDGPAELDTSGVPILSGHAFDRNEW